MSQIKLAHDARVLVADGKKALVLRNEGDERYWNLQVSHVFEAAPNPATRAQGTDAPGRSLWGTHRSAVDQTDWHNRAEEAFAIQISSKIGEICRLEKVKTLVLAAPPRTLAILREALPAAARGLVQKEVAKDLTKLPTHKIEAALWAEWRLC
jgi:protein required for attachment to host cells